MRTRTATRKPQHVSTHLAASQCDVIERIGIERSTLSWKLLTTTPTDLSMTIHDDSTCRHGPHATHAPLAIAFVFLICVATASGAQSFAETLLKAQAASEAKQWSTAAPLWEQVVQANPVNGTFALQLANALYQAKDYRKAIPAWEKALALRVGFPASMAYNVACSYALLGDKERAFTWLSRSFDMGMRNLELARTDADLLSLHGDPRFASIVGLPNASTM